MRTAAAASLTCLFDAFPKVSIERATVREVNTRREPVPTAESRPDRLVPRAQQASIGGLITGGSDVISYACAGRRKERQLSG